MRLARLSIEGFRCFGDPATLVDFDDLAALVGANGTGKTAVLMAMARMFGMSKRLRTLTREDFHIGPGDEDPEELTLTLEAWFEFPELLDDEEAANSSAVPECLQHILATDSDAAPECRIRLSGCWTKTGSPEGEIDQQIEWIDSLDDDPPEGTVHVLRAVERSLIQVFYIPATRDAVQELRGVSGTLLSRVLQHIEWPDAVRDRLRQLSEEMARVLHGEIGFTNLEAALQKHWMDLRGSSSGNPELIFADADLGMLLRRIDPRISLPDRTSRPIGLLSEGERSLLYFALVASALEFESHHIRNSNSSDSRVPILTILAVEEPENHLAPQYLSRILAALRTIKKHRTSQVVLTSHSASILRRVDPTEIRHFRKDDHDRHLITALTLPDDSVLAHKYIREAVRAYPELYFARAIILAEGPSEEVVLPRIAKALNLDIDPQFVAVVPLGGRHVNHFWRLLREIGTPFVTLVDLDLGRDGGGWGRIHDIAQQLIARGEAPKDVHGVEEEDFAKMPHWVDGENGADIYEWVEDFALHFDVFFSAPLDLDLTLLEGFTTEYQALAPKNGGPHKIQDKEPARGKRIDRLRAAVLGVPGSADEYYDDSAIDLFRWYAYLFLNQSKPVTHARMFASLNDHKIRERCPQVLQRLIERVKALVSE